MMCGVGLRKPLYDWLRSSPEEVECLELIAEHFFDETAAATLTEFSAAYPVFVHGLGLSLGSEEPLDEAYLRQLLRVVELARPLWISEHIAFTRSGGIDLGHLNPVAPTVRNAVRIAEKVQQLQDRTGLPVILENITSSLRLDGDFSEPEFLNRICELSSAGLLLDVTNLYINSRNHRFDPLDWLSEVNPDALQQLHVVGYSHRNGRFIDAHSADIQEELWELFEAVVSYGDVQAAIIERDGEMSGASQALEAELARMKGLSHAGN